MSEAAATATAQAGEAADKALTAVLSQREFNRLIMTVLAIGLGILAVLGAAVVWLSIQTKDFDYWVEHTHIAEQRIVGFMAAVERAETARRGYILGPTPVQLDVYRTARTEVTSALYNMASTVKDNAAAQANVGRLRPLLAWKTKLNDDSVALVQSGGQTKAIQAFSGEQELQPLLGIRSVVAAMMDDEQHLLVVRTQQEQDAVRLLTTVGLATAILLALLSVSSILLMRRFAGDLGRAQEELRDLNAALERRVEERTADLTRANQEIQRFAYIVSHDLRSPLVNVMGFTSELEVAMKPLQALVTWLEERDVEGRMPKEVRQSVDTDIPEAIGFIRSSTKKMDGLIGAILKLSREGRRVLHPERLMTGALVESLFDSVRHRIDSTGGTARVEGQMPDIVSDRLALDQVIGNLIDNAIKYHSTKRPLEIVVSGSQAHGRVQIAVADNGRGVDPKDHERIFELFRRSGPQTQPGEGIGLAHVRALVHRLGGTITCESELDQGAVFRLSLPTVLTLNEGMSA